MSNTAGFAVSPPFSLTRRRAPLGGGPARRLKRLLLAALIVACSAIATVVAINAYVVVSSRGRVVPSVAAAPHAQAAIVLGAQVNADGSMSAMLADRVARGAQLYRAGKVDRVIVSGDHGTWAYDEPGTMRRALLRMGVPAAAIFTDHAGFNTWASMKRARLVFGVSSAIVVTQRFHLARALFLADAAGIDAHGLAADLRGYGPRGNVSVLREIPARIKAFGQAESNAYVLLGPKIPITGDGRRSWGPKGP